MSKRTEPSLFLILFENIKNLQYFTSYIEMRFKNVLIIKKYETLSG
jgi:hypothetical protein